MFDYIYKYQALIEYLTTVFCYAKRPITLDVPMIPVFKVFFATRGKFIDSSPVSIAHQTLNTGTTLFLFIVPSSSISTSHFEIININTKKKLLLSVHE